MKHEQYLAVVRHGLSRANAKLATTADGLYYSLSGSDKKVPLVREGFRQGREVGRRLACMFPQSRKFVRTYHSEYKRVVQTVGAIQSQFPYKLQAVCETRLNKRDYGDLWNLTYRGVEVLHPQEWQRFQAEGPLHYRPPGGGENYYDVFDRFRSFIDDMQQSRGNRLIITHLIGLLAIQRELEGLNDDDVLRQYEAMALPNAYLVIYRRTGADQPFERCDTESIGLHSPGV